MKGYNLTLFVPKFNNLMTRLQVADNYRREKLSVLMLLLESKTTIVHWCKVNTLRCAMSTLQLRKLLVLAYMKKVHSLTNYFHKYKL